VRYYAVTPDGGPLFAWNCDSAALAGWSGADARGGRWPHQLFPPDVFYEEIPEGAPYFSWNCSNEVLVGWNKGPWPAVLTAGKNDGIVYRRV
jgi:hypothetical protein